MIVLKICRNNTKPYDQVSYVSTNVSTNVSTIRHSSSLHTPLYDFHVDKGGKMVDFAGWGTMFIVKYFILNTLIQRSRIRICPLTVNLSQVPTASPVF